MFGFKKKAKDPVLSTIGKFSGAYVNLTEKSAAATAVFDQTIDNLEKTNNELVEVLGDIDNLVRTLTNQRTLIVHTIDDNKVVLANIRSIRGKK